MDGIANVARQQQSQVSSQETQIKVVDSVQKQSQSSTNLNTITTQTESKTKEESSKIDSVQKVESLVQELNKALAPMGTDLKFGVDSQDVFYVSVIDTSSNKEIRRFPAEQAQAFLPKMQEVTGVLFDSKG